MNITTVARSKNLNNFIIIFQKIEAANIQHLILQQ
jgi:hypothetical protein